MAKYLAKAEQCAFDKIPEDTYTKEHIKTNYPAEKEDGHDTEQNELPQFHRELRRAGCP